jgi:hypothetical protein
MNPKNRLDKKYQQDYNERIDDDDFEQEFEDLPSEDDEIED